MAKLSNMSRVNLFCFSEGAQIQNQNKACRSLEIFANFLRFHVSLQIIFSLIPFYEMLKTLKSTVYSVLNGSVVDFLDYEIFTYHVGSADKQTLVLRYLDLFC